MGKFIRHTRALDICYEIIGGDEFDVMLRTWNMGQASAYEINEEVRIPRQKLLDKEWMTCDNGHEIVNNNKSLKEATWYTLNP